MYVGNKKKDILVPCEGPTDGLDEMKITTEAKYSINITKSKKSADKIRVKWIISYPISVDNTIGISDIQKINIYLMEKHGMIKVGIY